MKKQYDIYISSTTVDLREERQIIINAVLNMHLYPLLSENISMSGQTIFEKIKSIIDSSNGIIFLIGDNYGTIFDNNISYIEAEYNYALSKNKPILCLVKNINDNNIQNELRNFRNRILENNIAVLWNDINDLRSKIYASLLEWIEDIERINHEIDKKINKLLSENKEEIFDDEILTYRENLQSTLGLYTTKENNDIIGLMINNLSEIKQFYKLTKDQANNAYKLAKNSCIAGICLIVISVLIALIFNNNQIAVATTVGGVIVEVLSCTSLFVYQKTLQQLNYYYASLHNNERFLSLINIVGKTNIKDELYSKIVESELDNLKQYEIKNDNTQ